MATSATTSRPSIGLLCLGGDWACAHGDLEALEHVAQQLAERVPEPLHTGLLGVASACVHDPERAVPLWLDAKDRLRAVLAHS